MSNTEYKYLSRINTPQELRKLKVKELKEYAQELRHYIIECCATNPGHLGSSLGAVELTIASYGMWDTRHILTRLSPSAVRHLPQIANMVASVASHA